MKSYISIVLILIINLSAMTLKEAYDLGQPSGEYDKVVILEKGQVYEGGIFLGWFYNPFTYNDEKLDEINVKIEGYGAIIDLKNGQINFGYTGNKLDIDSCVILNGTVRFSGCSNGAGGYIIPFGSIKNVTFYNSIDYGVRLESAGLDMEINKNLVVNCITTGPDFPQYNSLPTDFLRTGTSYSFSMFPWFGIPEITENWSYNDRYIDEPMIHFSML